MKPPGSTPAHRLGLAACGQRLQPRAQLLAQLGRADLLRHADVVSCGRKTSSRPAMLTCVDSRAPLRADGVLDDLHRERLPLEDLALDGLQRRVVDAAAAPPARRCRSATCRKAARSRPMSTKALCMPGSTRATLPR
jgi:hypothetical protein